MAVVVVEVSTGGGTGRRETIDGVTDAGREATLIIDDEQVSRRHVRLTPSEQGLLVEDLASANGTFVNGQRITNPVMVTATDLITLGRTTITLVTTDSRATVIPTSTPTSTPTPTPPPPLPPQAPAPAAQVPAPPAPPAPPAAPMQSAPASAPPEAELQTISAPGIQVHFRPDTAGARAASGIAAAASKARARLAGFGSESWGAPVKIFLVDPFADPDDSTQLVQDGTIVNPEHTEIWVVVRPDAPLEPIGRALAAVFGAVLPAHDSLSALIDGIGLRASDLPDPDDQLRGRTLPKFASADGELGAAMALSLAGFIVRNFDEGVLRRFVSTARPADVDASASEVFGAPLATIERQWRDELLVGSTQVKPKGFLRLAATYTRPHLRRQIEVFVLLLFSLGFSTVMPFVTKRLLDTALPSGEWSQVSSLLIFLAAFFFVSLGAQVRQQYVSGYISSSIVREVRNRMFGRMQDLSASWFTRHGQGDVMSRFFSDVPIVEQGLSTLLRDGLFQIVSLVVSLAVCYTLDWRLALLITVGAPIIALVYRSMSAGAMRRSIATQEKAGDLMTVAAENFQAQQVVKAFSLKAREMARFDRAGSESFDAEMSMTLFNGWFMVSVQSVMSGLQIGVMALGAWLIIDGNLSIGAFVAFLTVMGQVLSPVAGLTALGQQLQQAMGAMVRVQEVMDSVPEVASTDQAQPVARLAKGITFEHVGFGYTSERRVLDDVTIQFPAGTRTAIVGPSGSGKSSILQLALRTYDPDDGSVRWDGSDLRNLSLDELRANIGVVFQDTFAFNDSIRENIRLGKLDASDADVEQAARQAELHDFVTGLPQGYDTFIGERGGMLSGGQRQRLAIARALLRNPSLLVLDEATSALDPRTERIIAGTLDRVSQGRTTIAVTHRLATVTNYDQIVMVVDGTITERGTHLELLSLRGQYADLWAEQAGTPVVASTAELTPPSGGRRLTRMTGNFKAATSALPPPLPPSTATDAAGRATRTFTAIR